MWRACRTVHRAPRATPLSRKAISRRKGHGRLAGSRARRGGTRYFACVDR